MKTLHVYIDHTESVTLRDVAGDGTQTDLLVKTKAGTLALRLIGKRGTTLKVFDLRARDRKRSKKTRSSVDAIMEEAGLVKWGHVR